MQLVVTLKLKARCFTSPSLHAHKAAAMNQTVSVFQMKRCSCLVAMEIMIVLQQQANEGFKFFFVHNDFLNYKHA
jgi:hypothetical protein